MRKVAIGLAALAVLVGAGTTLFMFSGFELVPSNRPAPSTALIVETDGLLTTSQIMENVQQMLHQHPDYQRVMRSHGALAPEGYVFEFTGTCANASDLIAAVTSEVRKTTQAPVRCTDPA